MGRAFSRRRAYATARPIYPTRHRQRRKASRSNASSDPFEPTSASAASTAAIASCFEKPDAVNTSRACTRSVIAVSRDAPLARRRVDSLMATVVGADDVDEDDVVDTSASEADEPGEPDEPVDANDDPDEPVNADREPDPGREDISQ
jgi:hypothetical protein